MLSRRLIEIFSVSKLWLAHCKELYTSVLTPICFPSETYFCLSPENHIPDGNKYVKIAKPIDSTWKVIMIVDKTWRPCSTRFCVDFTMATCAQLACGPDKVLDLPWNVIQIRPMNVESGIFLRVWGRRFSFIVIARRIRGKEKPGRNGDWSW